MPHKNALVLSFLTMRTPTLYQLAERIPRGRKLATYVVVKNDNFKLNYFPGIKESKISL